MVVVRVASLTDPALDLILDFAGEVGLLVILHSAIDVPFAKKGAEPVYLGARTPRVSVSDSQRREDETT